MDLVKVFGCYDEVYSYDEFLVLSSEGNSSKSSDVCYWLFDFVVNGMLINDFIK